MRDVKRLVWGVYVAAALSGAWLALASIRLLPPGRPEGRRLLALRAVWGGSATIGLIVAFGLLALAGFEAMFTIFHQISFANDLWLLDPRRDYLLMLFPLGFWFDAAMTVALRAGGGGGASGGRRGRWAGLAAVSGEGRAVVHSRISSRAGCGLFDGLRSARRRGPYPRPARRLRRRRRRAWGILTRIPLVNGLSGIFPRSRHDAR